MLAEELLAAWLNQGGCGVAVGSAHSLAAVERLATDRGLVLVRLNQAVLALLADPDGLAATEVGLAAATTTAETGAGRQAEPRAQVRTALTTAYSAWLTDLHVSAEPLVVADLELALAEALELGELAALGRPVLLLVPGSVREGKVRCHASPDREGELLPPALTRAVWEAGGQDSSPPTA